MAIASRTPLAIAEAPRPAVQPIASIRIGEGHLDPVFVRGVIQDRPLTQKEHKLTAFLLSKFPGTVSKRDIQKAEIVGGWVRMLHKLAMLYPNVYKMAVKGYPGKMGDGYGIMTW